MERPKLGLEKSRSLVVRFTQFCGILTSNKGRIGKTGFLLTELIAFFVSVESRKL